MHFLRKIIDSVALARLRQPRPQWIFKLSGTPIRKAECMHLLKKIVDSAALARLRQPRPQWIFKLSGTPIREARMYAKVSA